MKVWQKSNSPFTLKGLAEIQQCPQYNSYNLWSTVLCEVTRLDRGHREQVGQVRTSSGKQNTAHKGSYILTHILGLGWSIGVLWLGWVNGFAQNLQRNFWGGGSIVLLDDLCCLKMSMCWYPHSQTRGYATELDYVEVKNVRQSFSTYAAFEHTPRPPPTNTFGFVKFLTLQ